MPTLTDDELQEKLDEASASGASAFETKLVEGTSWKDAAAVVESARNADRKIGEVSQKAKTAEDELAIVKPKYEEAQTEITALKEAAGAQPPPPPPPEEKPELKPERQNHEHEVAAPTRLRHPRPAPQKKRGHEEC